MYNDKEIKFNFLRKNSMFGHNLLFNQNLKYKAHIIAVGNTKILHLNKEEFLKSLQNPNILEEYLKYMSWFTINDKEAIKILKIQKLEDRIFYILNTNKKVYRFKNISIVPVRFEVVFYDCKFSIVAIEKKNVIFIAVKKFNYY